MSLDDSAARLDASDTLDRFRERFLLSPDVIYLDGNSLGPISVDAEAALLSAVESWKTRRIEGWTEGESPWLFLPENLGARLAPLIGTEPDEVVATGSTTVNLHQLLATLYDGRGNVLLDAGAFPTDRYALQSHLTLRGVDPKGALVYCPPDDDALDLALKSGVTLAVLPSVVYTSGRLLDMARLTATAQAHGVTTLWDLSHSIGAVPHCLSEIGADGAFWCSYKWLSAGPGAVGGLYLNRRHHEKAPGTGGLVRLRPHRDVLRLRRPGSRARRGAAPARHDARPVTRPALRLAATLRGGGHRGHSGEIARPHGVSSGRARISCAGNGSRHACREDAHGAAVT